MSIEPPDYHGPAFLSYGFRPFFLCTALFAGVAVPLWTVLLIGGGDAQFLYAPREWHVHEMLFGFLPAVITGFLLTAIPNWTERPPLRGTPLFLLMIVWLFGRLAIAMPSAVPLASAVVDATFLVVLAAFVWREIAAAKAWDRAPIGMIISLYAAANILFHVLALRGLETDLPERMPLSLMMMLLALIGGRITPTFTGNYLDQKKIPEQPAPFSRLDGISLLLVTAAALAWTVQPQAVATGWILAAAGIAHAIRLSRWRGWIARHEPLVLILHLGNGWLALSLLALGGATLGFGLETADAVHSLTAGAMGAMTLAVMTRASLGHTGRPLHAGPMTVVIYFLVSLGAILRVFGPTIGLPTNLMLGTAAAAWSGAYLLFAILYGPLLTRASIDE
jgi:uncharacterized protein involved in response to NO